MADLQALLSAIDDLSPDELNEIYNHLVQRRQPSYWLVPSENLGEILKIMHPLHESTTDMTEQEINDVIDEALDEVRRERNAQAHRRH
jgi:hypothetical protein